jgi:hypothetical protein
VLKNTRQQQAAGLMMASDKHEGAVVKGQQEHGGGNISCFVFTLANTAQLSYFIDCYQYK